MSNKKYWQSFGELNESDAFKKAAKDEFKENLLPLEDLDDGLLNAKAPRRDFLKYLGFSTAAATIAASCEMPVRKAVPYLRKPDDVIPGVANYYASTYVNEGDVVPVLVKQRDGRPIKIEGNEASAITGGGTSAQAQASVLDLYDTTRLRYPMQHDGKDFKEVTSFDAFDKLIATAMGAVAAKPTVILTSTITSPVTQQIITEYLAKSPAGSKHVQYDAISYSGMILANQACYGKKGLPSYHFDNAKVIVSLGADFLGTWLSPVEFSGQYAKTRRITGEKPEMSRHIQFEGALSLTGSNADDRYLHKPSQTGAIALALLAKLGGAVSAAAINDPAVAKGVDAAAAALNANKGAGLVVCGSNDVNIQIIVNAINEAIGANGKTINWAVTSNYRQGIDSDIVKLTEEMNAGAIGALLIYESNPVYTYYDSKKFADGLKKVPVTVSFNGTMNETTELCKFSIPSNHWLESWGDSEAKTGFISLQQPTINPLFKTRPFQASLLKWSGNATDYETYFKTYWTAKTGSADNYDSALQSGLIQPVAMPVGTATFSSGPVTEAAAKIAAVKGGNYEVVIYQKVSIGSGKQANNPWLQETPDPISKVTWDNYAIMSPAMAKAVLALDVIGSQYQGDGYEVHPEKPTVKLTVNGKSLELPVLILPGVHPSVIAVALGYGRESADKNRTSEYIGKSAAGAGFNAYPLVGFDGTGFSYTGAAEIAKTGNTYPLGQTQVHGSSESRPVIYETSLAKFIANPEQVCAEPNEERAKLIPFGGTEYRKDATIYPDLMEEKPGIKWGMSIDLNTCTGCSACVVACTAENNVSVVGKTQVMRAHEMHWLRIDRYFTGDMNNPDVVFQPMMCQHCDNAPCENVCPVAATNHSSEGLNQMTYNRCIGTRYCANNCPFKVRRFNWLDFNGADSFPDNQNPLLGVDLNDVTLQMNDDLTRMVLNPDVTVRSRGVIEKCSFCVQRLQENKLIAKKAEDPTLIRTVKTACMQACPTHAISFGNVHDKESDVYKIRFVDQKHRNFYVLEQLHVLPNVSYLAKIKNSDRHVTNEKEEGEEEKHEGAKTAEKEHA
ncbi:MAG: 4Fe-4S dicluster protein [Ferruginibacter sp.]|uniref:TAT-variant-translocated molybdopterin oxidoreductase n=1 Tax=Ferruginibacter sp. TaxID=1940288 RepID=UPI002659FCBC|nr:TAT-variant-translocated molybdopterin oxidoreductase [Ferruginibacter sp.]MDB5276858.1 4Fe-4S dicluster protein [Ferruginibacter sp.]